MGYTKRRRACGCSGSSGQVHTAPAFVANTRPRFRVGHVFLFAEQGNPVRNRNTTGALIELSIRAVSMERSFFCESRSLIGKGPVGKAKRARGWNSSEHMSQKTYKKKDSRRVGGSFRCLLKMRRVGRCLCHKQKRMQQSIRFFVWKVGWEPLSAFRR